MRLKAARASLGRLGSLFSESDRKRLIRLFFAIVLIAILQVVGLAAVLPFLELAANPGALESRAWLADLYAALGLETRSAALIATGAAVITLLALSNAAAAYLVWQRQRISWSVAHHLSMRLVDRYLSLPMAFFLEHSSAELIRKNINDVNNIVNGVLLEGSNLATYLLTSVLILLMLMLVEPQATLIAAAVLLGLFGLIALARRRYLTRLGRQTLAVNQRRFETFVDLVSGIKAVKTEGAQDFFVARFEEASRGFSEVNPKVQSAAVIPRFAVEVVAFGGVVLVTVILVSSGAPLAKAMPALMLFAVAAYRLIPAVAGAFSAFAKIISSYPAIDSIYEDVRVAESAPSPAPQPLPFAEQIEVQGVSFRYDAVNPLVLNDVSLTVQRGEKIAFVGPSGSGKSTLIDMVMGLFEPQSGAILVDGRPLDAATKESWRARVGYVPQSVFLYDDTIARNVGFGHEVDLERLREACDWAQLAPLIAKQSDGYETMLGENGVRLSGGERQRIGLARAFYRRPDVLVLDEATSALDGRTEKAVIEAIERHMPTTTTLMIAHRISTVRHCDRLYVMDRGQIQAVGSFEALIRSNETFQELAQIS